VSGSRQREWFTDILEGLPSILFLALWQSNVKFAGWAGAALAAIVLIGFRLFRLPYNPIVLGINVHLLIVTPLIVTLFYLGAQGLGRMLFASSHRGVLVTVFLVGCALTLFSRRGFIGIEGLPDPRRWAYSLVLLAASIAAIAWSFTSRGGVLVAIAIPLMVLFGLRRLLIARWLDRKDRSDGLFAVASGSALATDSASEAT
jgi:hypothetical protein